MEPYEYIETILNMLISKSDGQFISKDSESGTYFINLNKTIDYEQIINNKAAKGVKLIFKFKGKTYYAKTNKKGIAKITIKKSVLKKRVFKILILRRKK